MKRSVLDLSVGVFVLLGILALGWLSVKLGRIELLGSHGYAVTADFPSVGGLKAGSAVEVAGVEIGRVDSITLDKDYQARVRMTIRPRAAPTRSSPPTGASKRWSRRSTSKSYCPSTSSARSRSQEWRDGE